MGSLISDTRTADIDAARERSLALICHKLFREPNPLLQVGRFELLKTLGRGGIGVVYEAVDMRAHEHVALKMLHGRGPSHLYRLKREFRSLAELSHPNLVALHELSVDDANAYFTMDLIDGCNFVTHLRDGVSADSSPNAERVRDALVQLCAGVRALHVAGKLHRDLKPSNVMVTPAGHVFVLDFGLVHDLGDGGEEIAGTAAYMAPEQMRGEACEASDWYSIGLIMLQVLHGPSVRYGWLRDKSARALRSTDDPRIASLEQLALRLTSTDIARRPNFDEIMAHLDGEGRIAHVARSQCVPVTDFVGRTHELRQLDEAFTRSRQKPALVSIRGSSGSGKTTLLQRFTRSLLTQTSALVLSGRCYERESVSYKAFDSVIDALTLHLRKRSNLTFDAIRSDELAALLHMFPVLGRVPALANRAQPVYGTHPVVLRRRSFEALAAVLRQIAGRQPIVLCIDDMQWSDADSGLLLYSLLCGDAPAPLLVVVTDRTDVGSANPAWLELRRHAELSRHAVPSVELELQPLSPLESRELAARLLARSPDPARQIEIVATESRGNPLHLAELARWVSTHLAQAREQLERPSIESLIEERIRAQGPLRRSILELIAAAGRPVPKRVIAHAAGPDSQPYPAFTGLRAARLVRVARRGDDEFLEFEHAYIGEAILRSIDPAKRDRLHAHLARSFEAGEGFDADEIIGQSANSHVSREVSARSKRAGDLASSTLAFARAVRLYTHALHCVELTEAERAGLTRDLGVALEHAGRGLEAAAAFQQAMQLMTDEREVSQLELRASRLLLDGGHQDAGEALLRRGYERLGINWPETKLGLWFAIARQVAALYLGLLRGVENAELARQRAEYLCAAGAGLECYGSTRALHNALAGYEECVRLPDPRWRARTVGLRGVLRCIGLIPGDAARGIAEQERGSEMAIELGDTATVAALQGQLAMSHYALGAPRKALDAGTIAEATVASLPHSPLDHYIILMLLGSALVDLGRLREARRRWALTVNEARLHADLSTTFWIHTHPSQTILMFAAGDRQGVQAVIDLQSRLRTLHPTFTLLSWSRAFTEAERELYWGTGASALRAVDSQAPELFETGYPYFTQVARITRTRACLAAAAASASRWVRARLLVRVVVDLALLLPWSKGWQRGILTVFGAGVAMLLGCPALARVGLRRALPLLGAAECKLMTASVRYCEGVLAGGASGEAAKAAALAELRDEGVVEPLRFIGWIACGFRRAIGVE